MRITCNIFPVPFAIKCVKCDIQRNSNLITCNDCGVQLFIRGQRGIKKLNNLITDSNYKVKSKELIELLDYFKELNEKLSEIEANKPIFEEKRDLNLQEKAIKKQLNNLRKKLEKI